nr:hypothetical protein [Alphaproteobacteria bacterium]
DVLHAPPFQEIAAELTEFLGDAPIVAHNAEFDVGFLRSEYRQATGHVPFEGNQIIDTVALARRKYPNQSARLDALCDRFGISLEQRVAQGHGALLDAELLVQVYQILQGYTAQVSLLGEMTAQHPVTDTALNLHENTHNGDSAGYAGRTPQYATLRDDERLAHEAVMAKIRP